MAYKPNMDEQMFFEGRPTAAGLYRVFAEKLFTQFPDIGMRVQKTQITFTNPRVFACVSFAKVRKAKDRPREYIVITLGLNRRVQSSRIDAAAEPYPGRWTHHLLIEKQEEIDDELMAWAWEAYRFAQVKVTAQSADKGQEGEFAYVGMSEMRAVVQKFESVPLLR